MSIYSGTNSRASKVRRVYVGVGNVAREVTRAYTGINNIARSVPLIPFTHEDSINVNVVPGSMYFAQLDASTIENFEETVMQLNYDHTALRLEQFALEKPSEQDDIDWNTRIGEVRIVSNTPGQVRFQRVHEVMPNHDRCVLVVAARFSGLRAGNSDIALS